MRALSKILLAGLLLALAACVSSPPPVEEAVLQQETVSRFSAPETAADRLVPLGGHGAASSQPRSREPARPEIAERERLGTRWGEEIRSPIRFVSLARFWPSRPEAQVTIRYDGRRSATMGPVSTIRSLPVADGTVEFSVLGARGTPMRLTPTGGGDLRLQGRSGDLYRLAFSNQGRRTVEVVATVDGLDVLNGRPGTIANRGYVVRPGDMLVIEGFRKSEDEVAAFRFSAPDDAYAANTPQGDPRNIGVIGVALFTLDDPANEIVAASPRPFPADAPDPRFAPPPTP
ncbi:hypothetical protein FFK22_029615 [Mycobacterium sp. KBS0706]|uniref:hypothetical protein n=1 Tax=Mycobacterium sp. KBS0706 TaxID=2578109 RepID=UPI00110F9A07|nr:hypothetical protein [Mycobacterium sp. KBS0706]TSD84992.1 hypothetical protein FFK22_029615 [Mycobacterium sp. KBS0706]